MFGCLQVALGLTLFFLGSRLLPSGQAALISTLETPLMPFWIWVGICRIPRCGCSWAAALVMGAVIADIVGDIRTQAVGSTRSIADVIGGSLFAWLVASSAYGLQSLTSQNVYCEN